MDDTHGLKADRRRRRPALSCVTCRKSKIRCDRNLPCGACVRSKHKTCVYEPQGPPPPRHSEISTAAGPLRPTDPVSKIDSDTAVSPGTHHGDGSHEDHSTHSLTGSTPVDSTSSQGHAPSFDVRSLLDRIRDLERRLEESTDHSGSKHTKRTSTDPELVASYPSYLAGDLHAMSKSVMSKTRYLGQSHWMNQIGSFKYILETFDQQCRERKSEPIALITKCKSLARTIKAQRNPELNFKFGVNIPPREIADQLVEGYLRTSETVFRIVHVPSFRKDYENFWLSPDSLDISFVIQLQLIMAIGSTIYDDHFTMRKSAIQWVYEARCWLISPIPKMRLTLSGLQVMILLCIAEQTASVGQDLVWISVGQLMRTAIYMGFHRDPEKLPKMSRFRAEMRRRLWNTILEIALESSMDSGGPPLISLKDYDTCAPSNCDDDQLTDDDRQAVINPPEKFTDMSIALALRVSFPARLAIARSLNDIGTQNAYDDTLRLHSQLGTAYKSLSQYLQRFVFADRQPTTFQRRFMDLLVRRYFMTLHLPYFGPALTEPAYAFSRKTVVEMAAKLYSTVFPHAALNPRPLRPPENDPVSSSAEVDDLARLTTCAAGMFRIVLSQASMAIGLELQNLMQEDDGLGPPTPRADLLNILRDSAGWVYRRIQNGETNIKGHLFTRGMLAHIDALMDGRDGPEAIAEMVKAGTEAMRDGFDVLKQWVEPQPDQTATTNDAQFDFDSIMTVDRDWEYDATMSNVLFDFTSIDSMLGVVSGTEMVVPDFSQW
ncbi:hypothetical protein F5Y04DRAFT_142112 [Hypomontagnella monticulosa]|nr:hypothetical protein F5Y04DRAFT_142112 [Hypomontagnella monticulosa]